MKTPFTHLAMLGLAVGGVAVASGAESAPAAPAPTVKIEKKQPLRVLAGPEQERRVYVQHAERQSMEKEIVAFLGVETSTVSATTAAQLGLTRGTGLVVNQLVPKSPAADTLKVHDILLKLDDQILIEVRQLSVLIRSRKEGDEVTLTYLRGGQKETAKLKLGKQEVSKLSAFEIPFGSARAFAFSSGGAGAGGGDGKFEFAVPGPDGVEGRQDWDRVLSLLQRARPAPDGPPGSVPPGARIRIDHGSGPGVRAMSINTGNSNLIFSDNDGSLELTLKDGAKALVAKDPKGAELFSGPVSTPEERKALPEGVRERLEKLEGMHDITFHTDGDFQGAETKVIRPRGISFPLSEGEHPRTPGGRFY